MDGLNGYQRSTLVQYEFTPYQALCGKSPPHLLTYIPKTARLQSVEEDVYARDIALKLLKDNLIKAKERMKKQASF